jgi:diguanylate cyclase (GGDEF)-like protein/PAS domain S-box-containing protein
MKISKSEIPYHSHLEAVFHAIAAGVIWFDQNGVITSFNRTALDLLGYSEEELTGRNILTLLSRSNEQESELTLEYLLDLGGGNSHRINNLLGRCKNNTDCHLDLLISQYGEQASDTYMGIIHDTSELKMSEHELSLAAKVFENMSEAVIITDAENNFVSVNPAFTKMTGYTQDEILGKNPSIMSSGQHDAEFYQQMWDEIIKNGYWQGEIWNRRKNNEIYPKWLSIVAVQDSNNKIQNYIAVSSDISERKAADERIHFMAHYDALTGLPNRVLLHDRLLQAILHAKRKNTKVAILFLDLDRFKIINDTLGHSVGDLLLQAVAKRLQKCVRATDTVARIGGDEFIIVLNDLVDSDLVGKVAQKIMTTIAESFLIREQELHTTTSIGISLFPADGVANEELISNADVAMYRAKENGKNTYQFFTSSMNTSSYERLTVENKLRRALERQEFILHYQPQVDSGTGKIIGAEALVRWQNPEIGLVPPDMFISLAEENGLIVPIGEWVLREACRQNAEWQKLGLPKLTVAVNLSAMQFHQKNLTDMIAEALKETGLHSDWLELEITESGIMKHGNAISTLNELRDMGIKLSIDDFGTGYSSLSHLKKFPLNKLKIDKSFVDDITTDHDDAAIASAIISMAKSLHLKVIAEGVENKEQLAFLQSQGCYEIQGYFFSRPLPAKDFKLFVEQWNSKPLI